MGFNLNNDQKIKKYNNMKTSQKKIQVDSLIKKIIIGFGLSLMIAWNINCFAQDTIIKNDGVKISGKVLEVSSKEVKYRKIQNAEGPIYIESTAELSLIKYGNGLADTFKFVKPWFLPVQVEEKEEKKVIIGKMNAELNKAGSRYRFNNTFINEREMQDYLMSFKDPAITQQIHAAKVEKGLQYIGFAAIPFGIGSLFSFLQDATMSGSYGSDPNKNSSSRYQNAKILAIAGVACIGTSICLKVKRSQHNANALKLYHQKY
jgi:hypothetical protein